jgi:hypothetical protein
VETINEVANKETINEMANKETNFKSNSSSG